jgi:predicted aspartyl protease
LFLLACIAATPANAGEQVRLHLDRQTAGTYATQLRINGVEAGVDCLVDSGATDIVLPKAVSDKLVVAGAIWQRDFRPTMRPVTGFGGTVITGVMLLNLDKADIHDGDRYVRLPKITAMVIPNSGHCLIGISYLSRFRAWGIEQRGGQAELVLELE